MKILNLYAGIGGNRKGWELSKDDVVVAVEIDPLIAEIYQKNNPNDIVIVGDAHQYLLEHFREFDFIWSSPPCPTHSKIRKQLAIKKRKDGTIFEQNKPEYPNMMLYQEIILLEHWFNGYYCVENVIPYYEPLIDGVKLGRHLFWSNLDLNELKNVRFEKRSGFDSQDALANFLGFDILEWHNVDKRLLLRNCVEKDVSQAIYNELLKEMKGGE